MKRTMLWMLALLAATAAVQANNAKINWQLHCAMCHGKKGKGNTPAGRMLGAPNYQDPKVQASFTDDEAFKAIREGIIKEGRRKMKSFAGELTDQDIRELVAHVRTFKKGK